MKKLITIFAVVNIFSFNIYAESETDKDLKIKQLEAELKDLKIKQLESEIKQFKSGKVESCNSRFSIRGKTFTDNQNGYMWEKPKVDNKMNWHNAKSYCENLNLDGYSDWRLPSRDELHTLMTAYYGEYNNGWETWFNNNQHKRNDELFLPKEISGMFPKGSIGWSWFWTSNINNSYSSYSWVVVFPSGSGYWGNQTNDFFVVCVRDTN